jgi:carbamoylphosphate synthase small subunit
MKKLQIALACAALACLCGCAGQSITVTTPKTGTVTVVDGKITSGEIIVDGVVVSVAPPAE